MLDCLLNISILAIKHICLGSINRIKQGGDKNTRKSNNHKIKIYSHISIFKFKARNFIPHNSHVKSSAYYRLSNWNVISLSK